jgi:hypothetical protein
MLRPRRFLRTARAALAGCLVAAALVVSPAPAVACPTCKDAIAQNDPQHQAMVKGYFYSILFMMSMPFIVLGTFGGMAYYSVKRARRDSSGHEA